MEVAALQEAFQQRAQGSVFGYRVLDDLSRLQVIGQPVHRSSEHIAEDPLHHEIVEHPADRAVHDLVVDGEGDLGLVGGQLLG